MSLERTFQGPMKLVPSPATANGQNGVNSATVPSSPTPSYTTASSTSAPSTPASDREHSSTLPLNPFCQDRLHYDSAPSSPSPSWSSPLARPSYYQHQVNAVTSPGNASIASSAITNRSGYEGDHEEDAASIQASRPSSLSSASSSSSAHHEKEGSQLPPSKFCEADTDTLGRAMKLLEEAVDQQASLVVAPRGKKGKRQCASQLKALNLFDAQYSGEANADTEWPQDSGAGAVGLDAYKSDLDKIRQRGAGMRALSLLNDTAAGEKHKAPPAVKAQDGGDSGSGGGSALTARRAAILAYEKRQKEKEKVQAQLKRDFEMYGKRVPKLVVPARSEAMAETSRKKKPESDEDVRDPETVSGMKCKLHWDQEKEAKAKALKLLNDESAVLVNML
jgi:hypothetical protein